MNRCGKCIVATVVSALVAHQPLAALAHANSAFSTPLPPAHSATLHNAALPINAFHNLGYGHHTANVPAALSHALQLSGSNQKLTFLYSTPVMQLIAGGHVSNHVQNTTVTTTPSTNTQTTSNSSTTTGSLSNGVSLNLASQAANLTANITSPVTIRIGGTLDGHGVISGGTTLTIKPGQMLTAAEYQALMQVQLGGNQTLVINGKGNAASGYLQLDNGDAPASGISTLVVPRGVTVDTVGYTTSNPFVVSGNVKVYGTLVALQPTASTGSVLDLGSLNVQSGARVTDVLPTSQSYLNSLFNSSSLTLNVANNVTNSGTIYSGGTLTVNAGGSISNINSLAPGASPAVMSGTNVVLSSTSGNFTNTGTITARSGDVSFKSPNTINLTNTNGVISAQSGNINFRDSSYTGPASLNVTGGQLLSQNVNAYSGTGNVTINANAISGANNVWANAASITTSSGSLNIGTQNLTGDPTYYNTSGNVVISAPITTTGASVAVAAEGNVTLNSGANITTKGGQINLIAGANFTSTGASFGSGDKTSILTVTGGSTSGGSINLNDASLNSSGVGGKDSNGGNVTLVAFAGNGSNSGTITSSPGKGIDYVNGPPITTGGTGVGQNGSVTVIAGANSGTAVKLGNITTTGGTGLNSSGQPTGNIQIYTSTPVVNGPLTIQNGAITAGSFGPSTIGGVPALNAGSVQTGSLTAGGQHLDVYSGNNVNLGQVTNNGIGANAHNEITVYTNSSSTLNITGGKSGPNTVGFLTANSGSTVGAAGGSITVINNGTGGLKVSDLLDLNVGVLTSSGNGGNVSVLSKDGAITLGSGTLSVDAWGNGNAGTINISGTSVVGSVGTETLSANARTQGNGGSITVTATGKDGSITSAGTINSSAARGAQGGNGGTVSYTAGGNINPGTNATINVSTASNGSKAIANGNGGNISLIAGTGGTGSVTFNNALNANGTGKGNGGSVTISENSSSTLHVGSINASSGTTGTGGQISITNNGTSGAKAENGGILVTGNLIATGTGGSGGSISVTSQGTRPGNITFQHLTKVAGDIDASGSGKLFSGGSVNITGGNVTFLGPTNLAANGSGKAGSIVVTANGLTGSIVAGNLQASATGGTSGGTVEYTAQENVTIGQSGNINVGVIGSNGNGGTIHLEAGLGGAGNVVYSGALSANGAGVGNGGQIIVEAKSASDLNIVQSVSANAGSTSGLGGTIQIENDGNASGNGGIVIGNNLSAIGNNANGGVINVTSQGSTPGAIVFANSVGATQLVNANSSGNASSNGGTIQITGGSVTFQNTAALSSNAAGSGTGGLVSVIANGENGNITGSNVSSYATGGSKFSTGGDGGTVEFTAAGHVSLGGKSEINVNVLGKNGNGGIIHLEAGTGGNGDVLYRGNLSANGVGTGNGGQIIVDARSGSTLTISQDVSANAGSISGRGGTISIDNDGSGSKNGGVLIENNLSAVGVNGNGGLINITSQGSNPGEIVFGDKSYYGGVQLVNANSSGSATSNGGTIQITGGSVSFQKTIDLTSNAAGSGTGGLVSVIANGENGSITGSNVFSSATGGSKFSKGGDGGTVEFTAAGNVNLGGKSEIDVNVLGQNGNGGVIHLEAGTGGNGDVYYTGGLSANGVGTGNGGQIIVDARSGNALTISQAVSANAGFTSGHGGTISIDNDGSGGKNGGVLVENNLSAYGVNGNGGDITITSQGGTPGKIVFDDRNCYGAQLINTSAYGTAWGNGGQINITGGSVQFDKDVDLLSNAAGPGTGGLVSVIANGNNGNITGENVFSSATGGSKGSSQGDGGTVEYTAAGNIALGSKSSIDVNVLGKNGNGGIIHLEAGTGGNGDVYFSNTLSANGAGTGNGGQIIVEARSGNALTIAQNVSANAGSTSGHGGTILIDNDGSGGKNGGVLIENNISAYGVNGNGGDITINSQGSTPGKIVFDKEGCYGGVQLINTSAYGSAWGNGGQLNITGGSVLFDKTVDLFSNAAGPGTGGLVSVIANGENGNITGNNVFSSATGGSKGSSQGDGGTVEYTAAGNIALGSRSSIDVNVLGKNGNGGIIHLEAGTGGNGDVYFSNTLSANGAGTGNGGQIIVEARSGNALTIAQNVSANAGSTSGHGGTILIDNDGSGGKNGGVLIENNISAYGVNGNGGDITINSQGSTPGKIVFDKEGCYGGVQLINTSAYGSAWSNGGQLNITGGSVQFDKTVDLFSNAAGPGTGGLVSVIANGENGNITGSNVFSSATGGSKGSSQGDGGTIEYTAAGNIALGSRSSIDVNVLGKNGNGGIIHLEAGTGGNGDVYFSNTLSANGAGTGNGGQIIVEARSGNALTIAQNVSANAGSTSGHGGTILIDNDGSGGKNGGVLIENNISAYGVNGNGGDITINSQGSTPGKIVFDKEGCYGGVQLINTSAYGSAWGNGGQLNITGGSVQFDKNVDLLSNAAGPGTGGLVSVIANGENGNITGNNVFSSATGGSKGSSQGDGGTVEFTAVGNIKLGSKSSIDVDVLGKNGNGGIIHLEAGTGGNGNVYFSNTLSANGKGTGNGGQILVSALSGSSLTLNQTISANGGSSGSGGTITIQNLGSGNTNGGIKIDNNVSANGFGGGNGGTITVTAQGLGANGVVTFGNGCCHLGEITANASGNNAGNGGTISIKGSSVEFNQRETITANGANYGSGGTVAITAINGNVIAQCPINIFANGGASGGSVAVSAFHNVDLDNGGEVSASATNNGNGGQVTITAGTGGKGDDHIDTKVLANGAGAGNGGCIDISASSDKKLVINGLVEADSGKSSGNGGTILIINGGADGSNGGIKIESSLIATGTGGGHGGIIGVYAGPTSFGSSNGFGKVVIDEKCGGEIDANATGSNTGNGGAVGIIGSSVVFKGSDTVTANGSGSGNGGLILVGAVTGSIKSDAKTDFSATGGSKESSGGNGGIIALLANKNVDLKGSGNVDVDALGKNGNGGTIALVGGLGGNGNVYTNQTLEANGAGKGNGGTIYVQAASGSTLTIKQDVSANGGSQGSGGTITIKNLGSGCSNGGIQINDNVTANGNGGGNGGTIKITAEGTYSNGVVTFGNGCCHVGEVTANANGNGSGNGGTVTIAGSSVHFDQRETITANGAANGNGGTINISAINGSVIAECPINIIANGGISGGTINVSANHNVDLDHGGKISASSTKDGDGGKIDVTAGKGGNGTFDLSTTIAANGAGHGDGGTIKLESRGSDTSKLTGDVTADSGKSGKGGTILVQNLGAACAGNGGLLIAGDISATGSGGHKGGEITINAGGKDAGNVTFFKKPDGTIAEISVNATGTKTANGGTISVTGKNVFFNEAENFSANAAGSGNGGSISIEAIKGSINGNSQVSFSATGGSVGSSHGNGGTISFTAGSNIKLPDLNNINVGPLGKNGNGGDITFAAGTHGDGILQIGTGLSADGVGSGNGGKIKLSYNDGGDFVVGGTGTGSYVNGNIHADATGAGGTGGTVSIKNGPKHDLDIVLNGDITAINTTDPNNVALYGNLNFLNNNFHAVNIAGPGQLLGITNAHGSSVFINPQHIDTQLTTGLITASKGSIELIVDCPTSRIVIPTGSLISTLKGGTDILIQGPTTFNYGTVSSNRDLTFATNTYLGNGIYTANGKITFEPCPGCGPVPPGPPDHHHTGFNPSGEKSSLHTGGNGQGGPNAGRGNGNGNNNFLASNPSNNTLVQNSFVPTGGNRNGNDQFVYSKTATDITEIMNSTNLDQSDVHNGYLEEDDFTRRRNGNTMIEGSRAFNSKNIDEQGNLAKEGIVFANGSNQQYWNLDKGNILFNPEHDIIVGTHEGDVHIAAGSSVFVMETGHDVYVYNLHQGSAGKVFVTSDKEMIKMDPGGLLVLTKNKVDNFEELDGRCHSIGYTAIQKTEMKNGVNAFSGRFSIPSAFSMVVPLKKMLSSNDAREKQMVDRILKSSVLLSEMMPTASPFQNGDMSR